MKINLKYAVSGALAGIVNGLLGAGGGLILVPLLIRFCKLEPQKALPCSVAAILPMCIISAVSYLGRESLSIAELWPFLAGGLAGGVAAGLLFSRVNVTWLRRILGVFILYSALRMLVS